MKCSNCGAEIKDNSKFCGHCGEKVERPIPKVRKNIWLYPPVAFFLLALLVAVFFIVRPGKGHQEPEQSKHQFQPPPNTQDVSRQQAPAESSLEQEKQPVRSDFFDDQMVFVEGGIFVMGCYNQDEDCWPDEEPTTRVELGNFYMSKSEITFSQFRQFIEDSGYKTDAERLGGAYIYHGADWVLKTGLNWRMDEQGSPRRVNDGNYPVLFVSWNDANQFCRWLSGKTGKTFRLPTEAEWEFAARGGNKGIDRGYSAYSGSNNVSDVAWFAENSNNRTRKVAQKRPNALGLYDMSGNAWEWVHDYYALYSGTNAINPNGPVSGREKVLRGGGWFNLPRSCRVTHRGHREPEYRSNIIGFRVVRNE